MDVVVVLARVIVWAFAMVFHRAAFGTEDEILVLQTRNMIVYFLSVEWNQMELGFVSKDCFRKKDIHGEGVERFYYRSEQTSPRCFDNSLVAVRFVEMKGLIME